MYSAYDYCINCSHTHNLLDAAYVKNNENVGVDSQWHKQLLSGFIPSIPFPKTMCWMDKDEDVKANRLAVLANIQAMVFGNMGDTTATGVGFTRDPSTGPRISMENI